MSPFRIAFGILWRTLGMIVLSGLAVETILVTDGWILASAAGLIALIVLPVIVTIIGSMPSREPKARFGVASIGINLAMALFAFVTLGLLRGLPLFGDVVLGLLAGWHACATYIRWVQFKTGRYLDQFAPKPPRPSLREQISSTLAPYRN